MPYPLLIKRRHFCRKFTLTVEVRIITDGLRINVYCLKFSILLVSEDNTDHITGPLHQPEQEQVHESVTAHVRDVDHHLEGDIKGIKHLRN